MNARTKLKRADQARKRRAKIADAKRKQSEYEQWQRNLVSDNLEWAKHMRDTRAQRLAETYLGMRYLPIRKSWFEKLLGY
jgi:hypothetical protein